METADIANGSCVALGNFDGLHIGHQAVLAAAKTVAQQGAGLQPLALLFDLHPQAVLQGRPPKLLMQETQRDNLLRKQGISPFHISFSQIQSLEPEAFVQSVLRERLRAKAVCCGYNYRFGQNAAGDTALLQTLCAANGIALHVVPSVDYAGEAVSSTRIRGCLERGELRQANAMLGRPFSYSLPVVMGDRRGRELGWPTVNQCFPERMLVPRFGVYASRVQLAGKTYRAVTNIGLRPTFRGEDLRSETHILGFSGDLYGQNIPVELLRFLREERRFSGQEELKAQIALDACSAEAFSAEAFSAETFDENCVKVL